MSRVVMITIPVMVPQQSPAAATGALSADCLATSSRQARAQWCLDLGLPGRQCLMTRKVVLFRRIRQPRASAEPALIAELRSVCITRAHTELLQRSPALEPGRPTRRPGKSTIWSTLPQ